MFRSFITILAILITGSLTIGFPEDAEARGRIGRGFSRSRARGSGGGCGGPSQPVHLNIPIDRSSQSPAGHQDQPRSAGAPPLMEASSDSREPSFVLQPESPPSPAPSPSPTPCTCSSGSSPAEPRCLPQVSTPAASFPAPAT